MRKYAYLFSIFLLLILSLFFVSCGKDGGPTTPVVPDNSFKVTDIKVATGYGIVYYYTAIASYSNYDDASANVSGKIYFGDGVSGDVTGPQIPKGSGTWQSNNNMYAYWFSGTYRVKVELTAYFKRGPISSTFEKNFTID